MRRVKLCSLILLSIIVLSIGSVLFLNHKCNQVLSQISAVEVLYEKKKTAEALEKTDELCRLWNQTYKILSILVKNDKLSDINGIMARLRPLLEENNEEVAAELQSAAHQLDVIRKTEFPYLHNIF